MDLYYTDPAQPLTTAGEDIDDLDDRDRDISDLFCEFSRLSPSSSLDFSLLRLWGFPLYGMAFFLGRKFVQFSVCCSIDWCRQAV